MKLLALVLAAVVTAVVVFDRFNRRLEAACALPVHAPQQAPFKQIPLPLELIYVTIGLSASIARTIRKAIA